METIYVRWRTMKPGSGYDLWDGDRWIPITTEEYRSYNSVKGRAVHMNPSWAQRG